MTPRRFDPRALDRDLVPKAARALRSLLDNVAAGWGRGRQAVRTAVAASSAAMRRADQRWASSGPLGLLRDVPQLALLLVAVVFVSGAAAAVWLAEEPVPPSSPGSGTGSAFGQRDTLGVPPGSDVDTHLAQAQVVLEGLAEQRPDARYLALVQLNRHVTVDELAVLLLPVDPQRAYLRTPDAGPRAETVEVPLAGTDAPVVLRALCAATAARKVQDAHDLSSFAATIETTAPEQQLARAETEADAALAAQEAEAFGGDCATAYAVLVEGTARELLALAGREGVRGVEVAPSGLTSDDVVVTPLLPETTGTVPTGAGQ